MMKRTAAVLLAGALLLAKGQDRSYRPQFHFSPARNWTNDPCGLVYALGRYHLFFQFNPEGDQWGHMSWGHAVSSDLVRWTEMPVAIREDAGGMIFTGSSVTDRANTSGLCARPGCIVSIYTGHRPKSASAPQVQNQNLAFSNDGIVWTKYTGNPVLDTGKADFRDPKVFWHEPSRQWVMVVMLPRERKAQFYGSPDLKRWRHLSDFGPAGATGGDWECPDFYELPIDDDAKNTRWVLKIGLNPGHLAGGSGEQYFIGRFDGERFTNDNPPDRILWVDYGRDCYCEFTFNNDSNPPHALGWMNNWQYAGKVPTSPWRGQMTVPRTLSLRTTPEGVRLVQMPAAAIESLRERAFKFRGADIGVLNAKLAARSSGSSSYDLVATIRPGAARQIAFKVLDALVGYDVRSGRIYVDRTHAGDVSFSPKFPSRTEAPAPLRNGALELRILADRSSIEVFADDGLVVLTNLVYPKSPAALSLSADGTVDGIDLQLWQLRSTWQRSHIR
ncbi:MAG TPA: glycoside hydrolase family 32 protein [Bryobacteraceae bacterium]|jgi:fructan beta-fructosidase|nr:glycoside hydrolase family 32 protein [Bryobacteraceae bacterium]